MPMPRGNLILVAARSLLVAAQRLPDDPTLESPLEPKYAGERCAFYSVRRLSWLDVRASSGGDTRTPPLALERDVRAFPRLGELLARPANLPNLTVCDGYGVSHRKRKRAPRRCTQCPGDPFARAEWPLLLCAPRSLAPQWAPAGSASLPPISVLLIGSDHNNHGLFAQVERVLNQLHLAGSLGLVPHVYLGRKVHAPPDSCNVGENQYFDAAAGPNVWDYYFEPVSPYELGAPTLGRRRVRLVVSDGEDARRHAIHVDRDAESVQVRRGAETVWSFSAREAWPPGTDWRA